MQPGKKLLSSCACVGTDATDDSVSVGHSINGIVVDVDGTIADPNVFRQIKKGLSYPRLCCLVPRAVVGKPVGIILLHIGCRVIKQDRVKTAVDLRVRYALGRLDKIHIETFFNGSNLIETNVRA